MSDSDNDMAYPHSEDERATRLAANMSGFIVTSTEGRSAAYSASLAHNVG